MWSSIWGTSVPSLHTHDTGLSLFLGFSFSEGWQPSGRRGPWDLENESWVSHFACTLSQTISNMSCKCPTYLCSLYLGWGNDRQKSGSYLFYLISVGPMRQDYLCEGIWRGSQTRPGEPSEACKCECRKERTGHFGETVKPIYSPGVLLQHRTTTTFFKRGQALWRRSHSLVGSEPGRQLGSSSGSNLSHPLISWQKRKLFWLKAMLFNPEP